jgi:hypothetical protein
MKRIIIASLLLAVAAGIVLFVPIPKYASTDILQNIKIPGAFSYWQSKDASNSFNLNDLRYNFISRIFARNYISKYGDRVMFLMLDAGNFHNPKVCFGSSGYTAMDIPQPEYKLSDRTLKANAVFFEKPGESYLLIYWITINKQRVDWGKQKLLDLYHSLFNKKKIGLMVRMDIPCTKQTIDIALRTGKDFITHLEPAIDPSQRDFVFGR